MCPSAVKGGGAGSSPKPFWCWLSKHLIARGSEHVDHVKSSINSTHCRIEHEWLSGEEDTRLTDVGMAVYSIGKAG